MIDLIRQSDIWNGSLQYFEDLVKEAHTDLPKGNAGLLKLFQAYMISGTQTENPIGNSKWMKLTTEKFDKFCMSSIY